MNPISIRLNVGNTRLLSVYVECISTIVKILKRLGPDLILWDLIFHILDLVSQRHLWNQRTFMNILKVLRNNDVIKIYLGIIIWTKHSNLLSAPIKIKCLPEGTNILHSLIAPSIKEGDYPGACKCFSRHCANVGPNIQGVDFDQSYSPLENYEYFRINITIITLHRLYSGIWIAVMYYRI